MTTETNLIRVLIVNDQMDVLKLWQRIINHYDGLECTAWATDGQSAIDQVMKIFPDIILMDIMMPGMDGLDATRRLREIMPMARIILYSAYVSMSEDALRAGADEFVLMPVPPDRLIEIIRHVYATPRSS
jgi:two-component system, NarL family, response regulator LiaR